jgi:deoxyadenosine/deoxycytidine kinase
VPAKFIAIAGNIGCGKTTLVDFLCQRYGMEPFFEPNSENPYLADFYADMARWAFHSQIFFLTHKFRLNQELQAQRLQAAKTVVQDRTIYEDAEIFATMLRRRGFIQRRDWAVYENLYKGIIGVLQPPDLLIYLSAPVRTLRQRIRLRGRPEEQAIPASYLRSLNEIYGRWFDRYELSPTVHIDTAKLNYLEDWVDRLDLQRAMAAIL